MCVCVSVSICLFIHIPRTGHAPVCLHPRRRARAPFAPFAGLRRGVQAKAAEHGGRGPTQEDQGHHHGDDLGGDPPRETPKMCSAYPVQSPKRQFLVSIFLVLRGPRPTFNPPPPAQNCAQTHADQIIRAPAQASAAQRSARLPSKLARRLKSTRSALRPHQPNEKPAHSNARPLSTGPAPDQRCTTAHMPATISAPAPESPLSAARTPANDKHAHLEQSTCASLLVQVCSCEFAGDLFNPRN